MNDTGRIHCYECGEELQGTKYHIGGDNYICEDCRDAYYVSCDDCWELVHADDVVAVDHDNEYVCQSCADNYHTCDHCDGSFSSRYIAVDTYYMTLCRDCYEDHYFTCADCREVHHLDDSEHIEDCLYCRSCADSHTCILSYGSKPTPVFYGGEAGYGLEVEIDNGNDKQEAARDIQAAGGDHVYIKEDGSLSCDGMEIVTHPATIEYHINHFPWTEICDAALSYGYRSHDTNTCGLHIHAGRSLFGDTEIEQDLTIAKIMLLFDRWYDAEIVKFARRDLAKMRRWADKPDADIQPSDDDNSAVSKAKKTANHRYKAINLCNTHTVEFRIFRGTLKRDTIIASIQWVDTLIKHCRKTSLKDLFNVTWEEIFCDTEHVELNNYLKQRKLYKEKDVV